MLVLKLTNYWRGWSVELFVYVWYSKAPDDWELTQHELGDPKIPKKNMDCPNLLIVKKDCRPKALLYDLMARSKKMAAQLIVMPNILAESSNNFLGLEWLLKQCWGRVRIGGEVKNGIQSHNSIRTVIKMMMLLPMDQTLRSFILSIRL